MAVHVTFLGIFSSPLKGTESYCYRFDVSVTLLSFRSKFICDGQGTVRQAIKLSCMGTGLAILCAWLWVSLSLGLLGILIV